MGRNSAKNPAQKRRPKMKLVGRSVTPTWFGWFVNATYSLEDVRVPVKPRRTIPKPKGE
jgi:hypothetical protein